MKVHFSRTKQIERGVEACVCVRGAHVEKPINLSRI